VIRLPLSRFARFVPVAAALATAGCFATRQDVVTLQQDISSVRAETQRSDSLRRTQLDRVITTVRAVSDTLSQVSVRLARLQGEVLGRMTSQDEQLLTIQELTGQSQRRLQELRADLERRGSSVSAPGGGVVAPAAPGASGIAPAPAPGGAARPGATPAPAAGPGPNQLYQVALDQLRRGSTGAARTGFQDLLRQYPDDENAPDALFYVAETHASDGNVSAADSTYLQVVERYPTAPRAATALYKHALVLQQAGRAGDARAAFQNVIDRYPRSDEADLARDRLKSAR
jgi:tol-pal system protein YbgF